MTAEKKDKVLQVLTEARVHGQAAVIELSKVRVMVGEQKAARSSMRVKTEGVA